jgi:Sec-independent protein translocase protein TatA
MNILGVGPAEFGIILLLMLVVAGPKRMAQWAYILGQYMAKLRAMWEETSALIKKELEQAGVEPEVVDSLQQWIDPRTRSKANPLNRLTEEVTRPVKSALKPVQDVINEVGPTQIDTANTAAAADTSESSDAPASGEDSSSASSPSPGRYDAWTPS